LFLQKDILGYNTETTLTIDGSKNKMCALLSRFVNNNYSLGGKYNSSEDCDIHSEEYGAFENRSIHPKYFTHTYFVGSHCYPEKDYVYSDNSTYSYPRTEALGYFSSRASVTADCDQGTMGITGGNKFPDDISRHCRMQETVWRYDDDMMRDDDDDDRIPRRFLGSIARRNERERNRVKTINHVSIVIFTGWLTNDTKNFFKAIIGYSMYSFAKENFCKAIVFILHV